MLAIVSALGVTAPSLSAACTTDPVVTTTDNDGAGSLRQAIIEACADSTITFNAGVTPTIALNNTAADTHMVIDKNLTIDGTDQGVTIEGSGQFDAINTRIFYVNSGIDFTLKNLTVTKGWNPGGYGGALYNDGGTVTLLNMTFSANSSTSGGGAIYSKDGTLTLTDTTLSGNILAGGNGGGLYSENSTLTLTGTTISSNLAPGYGGAIYNVGGRLTLTETTITGNQASSGGSGIYSTNGGTISLTDSTISDGTSFGGSGGIYASTAGDTDSPDNLTLTLINTTVSGQTTTNGGGGLHLNGREGVITARLENSRITGNHSGGSAGGIQLAFDDHLDTLTIINSTISDNISNTYSGGIYNDSGTVILTNSTVSGNSAGSAGGGIRNEGKLTVNNSTISGNTVTVSASGGGIYNSDTATLNNVTIVGNSIGSGPPGGGIYNDGGTLTLKNTLLANNTADSGPNCRGTITNEGNNLEDGTSCGWNSDNGSLSSATPGLGTLGDYGGTTALPGGGYVQTIPLLPGSDAIDAGSDCLATDQRGVARPIGAACDIGAFEAQYTQTLDPITFSPTALSVGGTTTASATASSGLAVTFTSTTTGVCTVSGTTVTGVAAGTCTIAANQAGNNDYSAATQITGDLTVTAPYVPPPEPIPEPVVTPITDTGSTNTTLTVGGKPVTVVTNGTTVVTATAPGQNLLATTNGSGTETRPALVVTANQTGAQATGTQESNEAPRVELKGNTTVTVQPGANVQGTTLVIPPNPAAGGTPNQVTLNVNGQNLTITPSTDKPAELRFTTRTVNGQSVQVLEIQGGQAQMGTSEPDQTLVAGGDDAIVSGSCGSQATNLVARKDAEGGIDEVTVLQCYVTLSMASSSRSGTNPTGAERLWAREQAVWDEEGNLIVTRLGSSAQNQRWVGDPSTSFAIDGLHVARPATLLDGISLRTGRHVGDDFRANMRRMGFAQEGAVNAFGGFIFRDQEGQRFSLMPGGDLLVDVTDTAKQEMLLPVKNGTVGMRDGVLTVHVVPAVADPRALATLIKVMGGVLTLNAEDGRYLVTLGAQRYAFQPGYEVFGQGRVQGFSDEPVKPVWAGHLSWTDGEGRTQVLHPVTADFEQLAGEIRKVDRTASVQGIADGRVMVSMGGSAFTLLPDYALVDVPRDKATEAYWFGEDGRFFVRSPKLNKAQGFLVR